MTDFYTQRLNVSTHWFQLQRLPAFIEMLAGKRTLHIGAADYPVFDQHNNLHLQLERAGVDIYGVDLHVDEINQHAKRPLTIEWPQESFDVLLAPEVLEHVDDAGSFIRRCFDVDAKQYIFTAPCAFLCAMGGHFKQNNGQFVEVVHPDHRAWYSPYTLKKAIEAADVRARVRELHFFGYISVLAICERV